MKVKSLMTMLVTAVALVLGVCSCGSDDDEPEAALAEQVAGAYTGEEDLIVMGETTTTTTSYVFTKSSDITVDMTIPASLDGAMTLPALPVKNIPVANEGNSIVGKLASYTGTVINSDGAEKAYTITNLVVLFSGKTVVVTYILKYGNMPFAFNGSFTGIKK